MRPVGRVYEDRFIRRSRGLLPPPARKKKAGATNPFGDAYAQALDDALADINNLDNNRHGAPACFCSSGSPCCARQTRARLPPPPPPQNPSFERTLFAPELADDDCCSLLDWSCRGDLTIALGNQIALSDGKSLTEMVDMADPITSISWSPDGRRIAFALSSLGLHILDVASGWRLTTLCGPDGPEAGSLAWKDNNLLTAGRDNGSILTYDVRAPGRLAFTYRHAHRSNVCALKWSALGTAAGQRLASAGRDGTVRIFNPALSPCLLHTFHCQPPVRAIDWCPSKSNLLAVGGGDGRIMLFDTATGAVRASVDSGAALCGLLWSQDGSQLLSSHYGHKDQLILWKLDYPSLLRSKALTAHTPRPIFLARSPDGCRVASAGGKMIEIWNVFPPTKKAEPSRPFTSSQINTLMHISKGVRHRLKGFDSTELLNLYMAFFWLGLLGSEGL